MRSKTSGQEGAPNETPKRYMKKEHAWLNSYCTDQGFERGKERLSGKKRRKNTNCHARKGG